GAISPLRMKASLVAEGVYSGMHRSRRRGAGVEFGGQRPYVPGDDLRFLDRRSLMRHDRLMLRQFETETEREMWICMDASASMAYRGPDAPGAKLAYAALLGAALTRVAIAGQDPVGLVWLGGYELEDVGAAFGSAAFERIVSRLERAKASGDLSEDLDTVHRAVRVLARRSGQGSVVVVFSDLLDLPSEGFETVVALASGPRALVVVQVLDPRERDLSFRGKVRLRPIEGKGVVVTDADAVRKAYREKLDEHVGALGRRLESEGGRLVRCCSSDDPVAVVRAILEAVLEARR
ncbi:MAG TPA: DUF58 domain-containing protein, partial [Polyangiaceae bacterium]|nr:DUF58 domain-containing protein [Polyangiaceae bacterium]